MSVDRVPRRGDIVSITPHGRTEAKFGLVVSPSDYYEHTGCIQAALISKEGAGYGYAVPLSISGLGYVLSDDMKKVSAKRNKIKFIETAQPAELASVLGKILTLIT